MGIRNFLLLIGWVVCFGTAIKATAAEFAATYTPLANSPSGVARSWFSGDVTNDDKIIYGLGHSHNTNGDNSLWLYDPATDSHRQLQPNTGGKWLYTKGVANSGRWSDPNLKVITNRNNHQAFVVPWRNEFWVLAGTTWYQEGGHFAGRYDLTTEKWSFISTLGTPDGAVKPGGLAEFSTGLIAGVNPGWVGANASVAVCPALETIVVFGGMNDVSHKVRLIEPNPDGPEPMRWAATSNLPIGLPSENARHNAVCVGDTVYFVTGQVRVPNVRCCTTLNPNPVWKFHVPSRTWTRLPDGPPGGYFPTLTYDSDVNALLYYGGGTGLGSNALWVMDLADNSWHDLTGTTAAPRIHHHTGGFIPGVGHVFKTGEIFSATGVIDSNARARMLQIKLSRTGDAVQPPPPPPPPPEPLQCPVGCVPAALPLPAPTPPTTDVVQAPPPAVQEPPTATVGTVLTWTAIPIGTPPNSLSSYTKHWRLAQAGNGRVYLLGGDGNGPEGNTGRQDVYSFDPLSPTGDWRLEAGYCGSVGYPVHWHTDEAGVAWDAKRKVFWKLAGTEYGPDGTDPSKPQYDACFAAGKSVKAKVITFDPATGRWEVPQHVDQTRFGYVANGVLDFDKDQMVQIIDAQAKHLDLTTGQWTTYTLPVGPLRFNAIVTRIGRLLWWLNREEALESYDLDTHKLAVHGQWPFPKKDGWGMAMTFAQGGKVLAVWPTSGPNEPRQAALYDPASRQWAKIDQGEGWGNSGTTLSDGRIVLLGGGINGPADRNPNVWIGTLK